MTKEQFLGFQPFEKQLLSARSTNYARFPHKELQKFGEAVEKWRGTNLTRNEQTCPRCLLKLLKEVCAEYIKYKESPRGKALLKAQKEDGEKEPVEEE